VTCWMYAYNRDPTSAALIPDGNYSTYKLTS